MKFASSILLYSLFLTSFVQAEKVGRVDSTNPNGFSCLRRILLSEDCLAMRVKAKQRGCITPKEYKLMERHHLCPVCDWYENGEDAYEGYCKVKDPRVFRRKNFGGRRFDFAERFHRP